MVFSSLPLIGPLFGKHSEIDERSELLIGILPEVIDGGKKISKKVLMNLNIKNRNPKSKTYPIATDRELEILKKENMW